MDTPGPSDSALLINLASFIVNNSQPMFTFGSELTPSEVSVLISLLASGAEIEYLALLQELPAGTGAELGETIKRSERLNSLSVYSANRKCGPAPELSRLVVASPNSALEHLTLQFLAVDVECMSQLCSSLSECAQLSSLTIEECDVNIPLLAKWISGLQALESLDVSIATFLPSGGGLLVADIAKLPAVIDLKLRNIRIAAENQWGGSFGGRLKRLALCGNHLNDGEISAIVDMIILARGRQGCSRLETLDLSSNDIRGTGRISELIACSPHLRSLDLKQNHIPGGIAPQALKKRANSLESLNVDRCDLGWRGIMSLLSPQLPYVDCIQHFR